MVRLRSGAFGLTARDGFRAVVADTNGGVVRGSAGLFTSWSPDGRQMAVTSGTAARASVVLWRCGRTSTVTSAELERRLGGVLAGRPSPGLV